MERLQKYLARQGVASRRAAEAIISAGRVRVNGEVVARLGSQVEAGVDRVEVDGREIGPLPAKVYVAVHKPTGVVTTTSDPQGRPTALELVPNVTRLFPVGRLDVDSEGLLLLTNDGELANCLTHPRYGCEKEYHALVRAWPTPDALEQLRRGVELDDGRTAPAGVRLLDDRSADGAWVSVTLREGRKRQVRRMLGAVGLGVVRLRRVRIGPLELGDLPLRRARPLSRSEIQALQAVARVPT